jgi:signal transduction histidine kinase
MAPGIGWRRSITIRRTIKHRVSRTFLLQAAAISIAAVVSVLLAAGVIKQVLVTEALRMEADYFWSRYVAVADFPLPDTRNLTGFMAPAGDDSPLPANLRGKADGFHDLPSGADFTTVYVTSRDGQRLFLVFDGERVNELAAYFGLLPLVVVLLALYLSVWLAFKASHRMVSPITRLAREVNNLDLSDPGAAAFADERLPADADEEVRVLSAALAGLAGRLNRFVERERTFTRDASHELRTPLTVIRVATDVMLERDDLVPAVRDNVRRIRRSSDEMERLVEAFLLLARETDEGLPNALVCVNDTVAAEIDKLALITRHKPIAVTLDASRRLLVEGPEQVVSSVIGNLLRNAVAYTDEGKVEVRIGHDGIVIEDSGIGMPADQVAAAFRPYFRGQPQRRGGHGVGLTIVKRFADRFGWTLDIQSRVGEGTRVMLRFAHAYSESVDDSH